MYIRKMHLIHKIVLSGKRSRAGRVSIASSRHVNLSIDNCEGVREIFNYSVFFLCFATTDEVYKFLLHNNPKCVVVIVVKCAGKNGRGK